MNRISTEKEQQITTALQAGMSLRQVVAQIGVAKGTVAAIRARLLLGNCSCGKPMGHKGWCKDRVAKSTARQAFLDTFKPAPAARSNSLEPGAFFLGFCFNQSLHSSEVPKDQKCEERSCVFPRHIGSLCYQHHHFFDWRFSMTGTFIDITDVYDLDHPNEALLSVLPFAQSDVNALEKNLKIQQGGWRFTDKWGAVYEHYDGQKPIYKWRCGQQRPINWGG